MRVFLSFPQKDAAIAAQIEDALRRRHIDIWSTLDRGAGEDLLSAVDRESANSDAYVFLLEDDSTDDELLHSERRRLFRNDLERQKTMIPILKAPVNRQRGPGFLRAHRPVYLTNFDDAAERIEYFLRHPDETIDPELVAESRARSARWDEEFREWIEYLRNHSENESTEAGSQ
ncbi:hypothetical protein SBA4_5230007 [Candidatus Sulfopaludibacter sp. SbA4]|nr:hypothetical protein SBA4_5230007 [Candidatus Sulfopaludibacter sp. SbA4]